MLLRPSLEYHLVFIQSFTDVDRMLLNYFTFRALKETLAQIAETDLSPGKGEYKWLQNFAMENNPNDAKRCDSARYFCGGPTRKPSTAEI